MKFCTKFIIVMFAAFFSFNAIADQTKISDDELNKQMQEMAERINKQLPRPVDDIITLLKVSYDNKTFSYFYKIDDLSQLKDLQNIEKNTVKTTCSTMNKIIESGFSYHYNYVAPNNEKLLDFTINQKSCQAQQ